MTDTRKTRKPLEREIERDCRIYAESKGCELLKFVSPPRNGVPDRILIVPQQLRICMRPEIVFIEFKQPGKIPTKLQRLWLNRLRFWGFESLWFDNFHDFEELVDSLIDAA